MFFHYLAVIESDTHEEKVLTHLDALSSRGKKLASEQNPAALIPLKEFISLFDDTHALLPALTHLRIPPRAYLQTQRNEYIRFSLQCALSPISSFLKLAGRELMLNIEGFRFPFTPTETFEPWFTELVMPADPVFIYSVHSCRQDFVIKKPEEFLTRPLIEKRLKFFERELHLLANTFKTQEATETHHPVYDIIGRLLMRLFDLSLGESSGVTTSSALTSSLAKQIEKMCERLIALSFSPQLYFLALQMEKISLESPESDIKRRSPSP